MMRLPVEDIREELVQAYGLGLPKRFLLKAPTGSGKSTAVPSMFLDDSEVDGLIVVIQPRRIAARMLAQRVASLRGSRVGDEVGYVVRFDNKQTAKTRIVFVTDGVFQNWCETNPRLNGIGCVLFDEFHERRVAGDVSLARCLNLQESDRPDLMIGVMSATIEMSGLSAFMAPCRELEASGRTYPVDIQYSNPVMSQRSGYPSREGVWDFCVNAAKQLHSEGDTGHILIFLPGLHEIRKTVSLLEQSSQFSEYKICPLYSSLSPKLQDEAVAVSAQLKIIVSTNVAETSLTIDGVKSVIDAGLARMSEFDANRGIETLMVKQISQASADQRAGRAGRTAPGKCVRLWSHTSHAKRAQFESPEIQRADVAELMLKFAAGGIDFTSFRWLDAPQENAVNLARATLQWLGAIDLDGEATELGHKMAKFPLAPRFSRLIFAGVEEGCLAEMCFIAAAIQGEGVFTRGRGTVGRSDFIYDDDTSDFAGEWRAFETAKRMDFQPKRCGELGILARGARECDLSWKQLQESVERLGLKIGSVDFDQRGEDVVRAAVKAFGDRMGVRLSSSTLAGRLCDGRKGKLDADSAARFADMFIPTEITEVDGKDVVVHFNRCISVNFADLERSFSEDLATATEVEYDSTVRRVVKKQVTRFKGLVIAEKVGGDPDKGLAAEMLAHKVASGELVLNAWDKKVEDWIARLLGLGEWMPELELPGFDEEDRSLALEQVCQGAVSYKEIKNREVLPAVRSWLSQGQQAALDAYAPKEVTLQNGRTTKIYYELGKRPWIALRAQLLFGVKQTPTIANGAVKLNVHICAPNSRPWQITDDLPRFWESGFEQMRKDLGGRYPKHQWTLE